MLLELEEFLLNLLVLLLYLVDVQLHRRSFIVEDGFCLLDLLHVVFHLIFEIVLEERQQVVLNVDLLDFIVDGFEFAVHFAAHMRGFRAIHSQICVGVQVRR